MILYSRMMSECLSCWFDMRMANGEQSQEICLAKENSPRTKEKSRKRKEEQQHEHQIGLKIKIDSYKSYLLSYIACKPYCHAVMQTGNNDLNFDFAT